MADYRILICHNKVDGETFKVESVQNIPDMYRDSFYHYKLYLRYNPQENNVVDDEVIKEMCYLEIIEALSTDSLWEEETGFYMVDCQTFRPANNVENINNSTIKSLASDFEIDWNQLDQDDDFDEDDLLSDDSGYDTPSASSTVLFNDEDLEFSSFSDDDL